MKNILTIAFCFLTMSLFSQVDFQRHTINSNLLSLSNPYYTSYTIGYEYRPVEKFGIEFTYGIINTDELSLGCDNYYMDNGRGNVYRIEPKYYFKTIEDRDTVFSYFASVKFYKATNSYESKRYFKDDYEETIRLKVGQEIFGVIPTLGVNYIFNDHFFVETSIGLGLRQITSTNHFDDYKNLAESCYYGHFSDLEENGTITKIRLNLNLKVGVAF